MALKADSLKTLSNIAQILQKSHPLENPLAHIVTMVRQQMQVDVCSLYLHQGKVLILVASDGLKSCAIGKVRMKVNEGLTGLAVEKLQPVIVNEAHLHPRYKFFPETGEEKFHSFAAVPLINRDQVVGVLTIQTEESREFSLDEIEVLKLIAFQLSGVIQNLVALEALQQDDKRHKYHFQLSGIPTSPGFGIGPAFFLRPGIQPVILPPSNKVIKPEQEWKSLKAAIQKAAEDLEKLEKKLRKTFTKNEADIFYSHRMILSDEGFLKRLKNEIERKLKSAAESVSHVLGEYIRDFEQIEDPHFRERIADLEDLRQRILERLLGKMKKEKNTWAGILISESLVPSDTAQLDPERISGIVTSRGGSTSHAAILARSLGIPAVMGISGATTQIEPGDLVIVDGNKGLVYINPERDVLVEYEKIQEKFADRMVNLQKLAGEKAITTDGHQISLQANVGRASDLKSLHYVGAEGVGLYRTEFAFMSRKNLPGEEEQFQLYKQIIEDAAGLLITFRILDAGGDKPIASLTLTQEPNPFLGYRSIRLSLSKPEILEFQFKALLRASKFGSMRIMVPMISSIEEMVAVRKIFEEAKANLRLQKIDFNEEVPLGIMIEVPSAVTLSHFLVHHADFFSIGTNDLIQYTLAVDRNNEKVASFYEPFHPAIISAIWKVAQVGLQHNKPVGVCGEIAGDPLMGCLMIGLGVTQLSMIAANIPLMKKVIRESSFTELKAIADSALKASTTEEIKNVLLPLCDRLDE